MRMLEIFAGRFCKWPTTTIQVDLTAAVEDNTLLLQKKLLQVVPFTIGPDADTALAVDHPLPGHIGLCGQCGHGKTDRTRRATEPPGDLAVSCDISGRNLPNKSIDPFVERRLRHLVG